MSISDNLVGMLTNLATTALDATYGDYDSKNISRRTGKSIKTLTKDLILQYPLLISQNISVKNAEVLALGFEQENAILTRLFLQNDLGKLTSVARGNTAGVLKQIHTNINSNVLQEMKNLEEENNRQMIPIEKKFNPYSLNEATLPKYLKEAISPRQMDDIDYIADANTNVKNKYTRFTKTDQGDMYQYDTTNAKETTIGFTEKNPFKPDMFEKINKLAPTFLQMKLHVANSTETTKTGIGGAKQKLINSQEDISTKDVEILFGVKCVVHPLKSDDIIHNVRGSFSNTTMFKLVKWTTGEYSFAKGIGEILFDFDRMKNLGIQTSKTSNYWWFKLRKLKNANKSKFWSKSSRMAPIKTATLMLSVDEVDYIKTNYRIDLKSPKIAFKLMTDLFLLNFGYIDESTETVYLFDEVSKNYIIKEIDDFKGKSKGSKPLNVDDIKSLFGR